MRLGTFTSLTVSPCQVSKHVYTSLISLCMFWQTTVNMESMLFNCQSTQHHTANCRYHVAKHLYKHFSREDKQMLNKDMKKDSPSLIIKEI